MKSLVALVLSEIHQDGVLGSLLFICFINDMSEVAHSSLQMFTDDTNIFRTVNNPEQAQLLQGNLNTLEEWSNLWQLRFNAEKCKVMYLGSRNKRIEYHMHKEGVKVNLHTSKREKDIGVYVYLKLTFSKYCKKR